MSALRTHPTLPRRLTALVCLAGLTSACSHGTGVSTASAPSSTLITLPTQVRTDSAGIAHARADSLLRPYTEADIHFMTGMVSHHSQAIIMSHMAPSHGAGPAVQRLADRIINAQLDEIVTMQQWLADRQQPVPPPKPLPMKMMMDGMEHEMLHPGMLSDAQMAELDRARGAEFDRLFLTYMMQHHRGAVLMVQQLFGSNGAAQDQTVFKFANDVQVDQNTEIARMEKMLNAMTPAQP